jgi:DNA-binding NarL/FixJ family response regulator
MSAPAGDLALQVSNSWVGPIDMLVTDVAMPGMNGPDLAEQMMSLYPNIAVLFISSNTAGIVIPDSASNVSSFLPKPFRPSQLLTRVRELLDVRRQIAIPQVDEGLEHLEQAPQPGVSAGE